MESLCNVLFLLFEYVSSRDILENRIDYHYFPPEVFKELTMAHLKQYSGNEAENLYRYVQNSIRAEGPGNEAENLYRYTQDPARAEDREKNAESGRPKREPLDVFEVLNKFNTLILKEVEEIPVCRYRYLLKWRMVSFELEEELFTTSFLAWKDWAGNRSMRTDFGWKYIINSDNVELNNIMNRGLVDNHYHLKGSAPYFYMSWINLMNQVNNQRFIQILSKYDESRQGEFKVYQTRAAEESFQVLWLQAAYIRVYLYSWLTGRPFWLKESFRASVGRVRGEIDWSEFEDSVDIGESFREALESLQSELKAWGESPGAAQVLQRFYDAPGQNGASCSSRQSGSLRKREQIKWLCRNLRGKAPQFCGGFLTERGLMRLCFEQEAFVKLDLDFVRLFVFEDRKEGLYQSISLYQVEELLRDGEGLKWERGVLQQRINNLRAEGRSPYEKRFYDYTQNRPRSDGEDLYGERWFLYHMFRKLFGKDREAERRGNLFYAYLVIKERIRSELIQVNNRVGFDNFLRYQNRKEEFIDNTPLEKVYGKHAVMSSFNGQPLRMLEARITPRNSAIDNCRYIRKMDKGILGQSRKEREDSDVSGAAEHYGIRAGVRGQGNRKFVDGKKLTKEDFFYVFHFVKEPDSERPDNEFQCRHVKLREKVKRQALGIFHMRQKYPEQASRVYGIDACSPEIGCRPEVFAQAFRFLKNEQNFNDCEYPESRRTRLRSTYHVGEDFLDIVDGMRAIDEAIYFLNMTHGDRLGHALALGVSPREWYRFKGNRVLCSRQDALDNIVWIYQRIRKYNICHTESILLELKRRFVHLYQEIYGSVARGGQEDCDIELYYDAWKLRGDNPDCYYSVDASWRGVAEPSIRTVWNTYDCNIKYGELDRIRRECRCAKLYQRYHYDARAKKAGRVVIECQVSQVLINVIEEIQFHLQQEILEKGLAIEVNPSSNYLIGTFRSYDRHPIVSWYNKGLTDDPEELKRCPQLDVTINTDDQAVFGTSLENEFALMAVALEKAVDGNGNLKYKKDMIYDWLDAVRQKGFTRCFRQQRNDTRIEVDDG